MIIIDFITECHHLTVFAAPRDTGRLRITFEFGNARVIRDTVCLSINRESVVCTNDGKNISGTDIVTKK